MFLRGSARFIAAVVAVRTDNVSNSVKMYTFVDIVPPMENSYQNPSLLIPGFSLSSIPNSELEV